MFATVIASLTVTLVCEATAVIVNVWSCEMSVNPPASEMSDALASLTITFCPTASVPVTVSTTNVVEPDNAPLTVATAPDVLFNVIPSPPIPTSEDSAVPDSWRSLQMLSPPSSTIVAVPFNTIATWSSPAS